mmetsp:Transcript_29053/g.41615  ORF Transcript_29053/g.41615 Transcript_29053/m.41615 type:complete len:81 (-) Transcript_29053:728-970(-)
MSYKKHYVLSRLFQKITYSNKNIILYANLSKKDVTFDHHGGFNRLMSNSNIDILPSLEDNVPCLLLPSSSTFFFHLQKVP